MLVFISIYYILHTQNKQLEPPHYNVWNTNMGLQIPCIYLWIHNLLPIELEVEKMF